MNKEKNMDHFMALNYDVVMRRKKDDFCMFIPELSIIGYGKTVDDAYENLTVEKEKYFKNIMEYNLEEAVNEPAAITKKKKQYHDMVQFILKIFFIFILIVIFLTALLPPILSSFEKAVSRTAASIPKKVMPKAVEKLENQLNKMTEKEKEEIRLRIRNVVTDLKPFADELRVLFEDDKKTMKRPPVENKRAKAPVN